MGLRIRIQLIAFAERIIHRWPKWKPLVNLLVGNTAQRGYLAAMDQGLISATNFIASIILARKISPTEFGAYGVGFILIHLIRSIQDGVLVQPVNALGSAMKIESFRRYVSSAFTLQIGLAALTSLGAAIMGWILIITGNDTAGPTLFALWFCFLCWQPQEFIRKIFYARARISNAIANTTVSSVIRILVLVWLGRQGKLTGIVGLDAIAWGALAGIALGLWQAREYWTAKVDLLGTARRNWEFGRWVLGGTVANWITLEFYPVLAAGIISFAAAGAYRALQTVVAPVHLLLRATDSFFTPNVARLHSRSGQRGIVRSLRLIYLLTGIPILGYLILASIFPGIILRLLFGPTYLEFQMGLPWMALFYALWFAYWPLQSCFKAIQRTFPIFIANIVAILCMFTVGILAIHRWELYGAIGGQALNAGIVGLILWGIWFFLPDRDALPPIMVP